jgi:hypothetical protein
MATFDGLKLSKEQMEQIKNDLIKVQNGFNALTTSAKQACDAFIRFKKAMSIKKVVDKLRLPIDKIVAYNKKG